MSGDGVQPATSLRERLQSDLREAMRARHKPAIAALRSALSVIANAEAVEVAAQGYTAPVVGTSTDVPRKALSHEQIVGLLHADAHERRLAVAEYERLGKPEDAGQLRAELDVLVRYLEEGSEWASERLDVDAYLDRISYEGELAANIDTLRGLHRAHVAAIPFENLDILLGRGIRLDIDSLQDKLVRRSRGGYCFEHNLLFAALLERLGFRVTRLAARVQMGSDELRARTHIMLTVQAGGATWLADVGFGGEGLLEPLLLEPGISVRQGGWSYRLEQREAGSWVLRSLHSDGWFDLYRFDLEPQHHVDFAVYNHYTATHPASPFVRQVVAQQTGPELRRSLRERSLAIARPDGTTERSHVPENQLAGVLESTFGIVLEPDEAALLQREHQP